MSEIKVTTTIEYEGKSKTFEYSIADEYEGLKWIFGINPYEAMSNIAMSEAYSAVQLTVLHLLKDKMPEYEKSMIDWSAMDKYTLE